MLARTSVSLSVVSISIALLLAACGGPTRYSVRGSQRDPGADADLQVETIQGGNRLLTFHGRNMTPPDRLGQGVTRYVLWVRTSSAPATMEAVIDYNPDSREGRATATTPHTNFTVLVTAEGQGSPSTPSDRVIFTQNVGTGGGSSTGSGS